MVQRGAFLGVQAEIPQWLDVFGLSGRMPAIESLFPFCSVQRKLLRWSSELRQVGTALFYVSSFQLVA